MNGVKKKVRKRVGSWQTGAWLGSEGLLGVERLAGRRARDGRESEGHVRERNKREASGSRRRFGSERAEDLLELEDK